MPRYAVTYPIAGSIRVEVDAATAEEALEIGTDVWFQLSRDERDLRTDWDIFHKLVDGQVIHATCVEAGARLLDETKK